MFALKKDIHFTKCIVLILSVLLVTMLIGNMFTPLFYFQVGTNLPEYIHGLEKDGGRKQPFVLLLGDKLAPSQVFVIIERTALPQNSVLNAVDACFKAFQILNFE